jgi:peptidoglycan/xylan/chitin deacetylase (PgdA/CDA1 family)
MYHHVDSLSPDPWKTVVSPATFEKQLQWLKEHCTVLPLHTLMQARTEGILRPRSIAITFDDGYLNNLTKALPLLEQYDLPATFFIPTRNLLDGHPFWWDELQALLLGQHPLPVRLSLTIGEESIDEALEAALHPEQAEAIAGWDYTKPPPCLRASLFLKLWEAIRALSYSGQQQALTRLKEWAGIERLAVPALISIRELETLAKHPLISLQAHTVSHAALGLLPAGRQLEEIYGGKMELEGMIAQEVDYLAYPYGHYNRDTLALSREAGFKAAFTTEPRPLRRGGNPYAIGRAAMEEATDCAILFR